MSLNDAQNVLDKCRAIAVVGLSAGSTKENFLVASYLKGCGYRIVLVNPNANNILGEKSYSSLTAIPPGLAKKLTSWTFFEEAKMFRL